MGCCLSPRTGRGGSVFLAIRPGGQGDITDTHVVRGYDRGAPYVPSPIVVGDYLYAVRNGGVATCLEAKTGKAAAGRRQRSRQHRLGRREALYDERGRKRMRARGQPNLYRSEHK